MKAVRILALPLVLVLALAGRANADSGVATAGAVSMTATITALDAAKRHVHLKGDDGVEQIIAAGPEVKRFDELKVGDRVTFTYSEALALSLQKSTGKLAAPVVKTALSREGKDSPPGGSMTGEVTAVVEVKALDPAVPSITVVNHEGKLRTLKIADKSRLEGIRAGDRIEVVYTEAFFVSVEPAAKK